MQQRPINANLMNWNLYCNTSKLYLMKRKAVRLQKKGGGLLPKITGRYWICQMRNGVFRPMNITKLIN